VARTLVGEAMLRTTQGKLDEARRLLGEAAAIFDALGTLDEPERVRAALRSLPGAAQA
jgi:hypothetical protein